MIRTQLICVWLTVDVCVLMGCKQISSPTEEWSKAPSQEIGRLLANPDLNGLLPEGMVVSDAWYLERTGGGFSQPRIVGFGFKTGREGFVFDTVTTKEGALKAIGKTYSDIAERAFGSIPDGKWDIASRHSRTELAVAISPCGSTEALVVIILSGVR